MTAQESLTSTPSLRRYQRSHGRRYRGAQSPCLTCWGLVIDTFGELRSLLQSVKVLSGRIFNKVPHACAAVTLFSKLFFLMHWINKLDTEYAARKCTSACDFFWKYKDRQAGIM